MKNNFEQPSQPERGEGAKRLHELEATGQYVFHGSPKSDIDEFELRQPRTREETGEMVPDGEPCIATSRFADHAIFRALVHEDSTAFGQNEDGTLNFGASDKAMEAAQTARGFVYVLDRSDFEPRHGDMQDSEWRSYVPVKPVQIVAVSKEDLPPNIARLPSGPQTKGVRPLIFLAI